MIGLLVDRPTAIIGHDGLGSQMFLVVHQTRRPLTKMSSIFRVWVKRQRQANLILDSRNGQEVTCGRKPNSKTTQHRRRDHVPTAIRLLQNTPPVGRVR